MAFESAVAYERLSPYFRERVRQHEPLAQHSSFGVGGPADLWLSVETRSELSDLISLCARERWPLRVVGAGSNILYADAGMRGIVATVVLQGYHFDEIADETALLVAEAGVQWATLLKELAPRGWGGLEFAVGIPGTVGAGVISNVGAHKQEVGQVLEWIEVLDARASNREAAEAPAFPVVVQRRYPRESLDLAYRHSRFRDPQLTHIDPQGMLVFPPRKLIEPDELVVALALHVHKQDPNILARLLESYTQERVKHDPSQRHLGSIFKDPPAASASLLIEQVGLSGKTRGNAQISPRNANYIVNLGGASAADIAALLIEAHQRVLAQTGIHLALNVEMLGEWPSQEKMPGAETL